MEEFFNFLNALLCQINNLVLLIHDEIAGLLALDTKNRIHLGQLFHVSTTLHRARQDITGFIKSRGFAALTGDNKRCTRLINQYRVNLIDNCKMKISKYELFLVDYHIVTQIIKAKLIVGHIGDITVISLTALLCLHII